MVCSNLLLHHQDFGVEGFTLLLQIPKWRVPFSIAWAARNTGQCTGGHTESDDGRVQNVSERFYCGARLKSSEHVKPPCPRSRSGSELTQETRWREHDNDICGVSANRDQSLSWR